MNACEDMIQTRGLCKTYGRGAQTVHALQDVTLSIKKGALVSVTGKSGCGKTTLLNLLGGLDAPTAGEITIQQENIAAKSETELSAFRRKQLGFVFQFFNLIPELNVRENIIFPVLLDKQKVDSAYFDRLVDLLELEDRLSHLPSQLSGGQQQRVAIARAFIAKPSLVLLDEPTGNLDEASSEKIMEGLQQIHKEFGQTMVLVTHNKEAAGLADTMIRLKDGRIEAGEAQ